MKGKSRGKEKEGAGGIRREKKSILEEKSWRMGEETS